MGVESERVPFLRLEVRISFLRTHGECPVRVT